MRIVVSNTELQIPREEVVAVSLQADSLESAESIQSSFTNEIAIPLTRVNRTALGNIQAQDAQGNEYTAPSCQLYTRQGFLLLNDGKLLPRRIENASLIANVYEGAANFFDELEGYTLQMIAPDSIGTPVARTEANVVANIDNDYTSGFSYATADFGDEPATTYTVANMWPFTFAYELFQKLAEETTYTFDTTTGLFTDSLFRQVALAYAGDRYNKESYFIGDLAGYNVTSGTAGPGVYVNVPSSNSVLSQEAFDLSLGFTIFEERKSLRFEAYASIDITTSGGNYEYNMRIHNFTQNITYATYSSGAITGAGANVTVTFTLATDLTRNYNNGDEIRLEIDAVTGTLFDFTEGYFRNDDGRSGRFAVGTIPANPNLYAEPSVSFDMDPLGLMPDLSAVDFIKGVCNMFGARIDVDNVAKIIKLRKHEDYLNDTSNADDWSDKVDSYQDLEIEYEYGNYSQTNTFTYDSEDDVESGYGNASFNIASDQLEATNTDIITLPFAGSFYNDLGKLVIPILTGSPIDLTEELNPRICYLQSTTGSITIGSTGVTDYNETFFSQLAWDSLLSSYWARFQSALANMEKVTVYLKLNAGDFAQLDFFTPKYISFSNGLVRFGGYYFLQLVDEYKGDETVKCELINLNI